MQVVGYGCLLMALALLAGAYAPYTIQSAAERGPFGPRFLLGLLGAAFGVAAFALIPGER